MSVQILVQGKLFGAVDFLLSPIPAHLNRSEQEKLFWGRSQWMSLLSEVLPRALIAELSLSKMLLGSSGGGQFLVVLPEESRVEAEQFLQSARSAIEDMSG